MDLAAWIAAVNADMKAKFAIDLTDAGLDDSDLARYHAGEPDPVAFVEWYGIKYDLDKLDPDYDAAREQRLADGIYD